MMNDVKTMKIETSRLIIRPYREEDFEECFQLMQNKELFKYMGMSVMSFEEYRRLFSWLISSYDKSFDEDFQYSFNITLKETGAHIGWCGIGALDYDIKQKEIYYLIGKDYWGNGYAKEATVALLDYGFNIIGLNEIVALCKKENIASKSVIENMGLEYQYVVEGLSEEFDFYNGELFFSLKRSNDKEITIKNIEEKNIMENNNGMVSENVIEVSRVTKAEYKELLKLFIWRSNGEEQDIDNLMEKDQAYFDESINGESYLDADYFWVYGAKLNGKYIGYINVVMIPKADRRKGTLYIDELWVAKEYRRLGAAKLLMDEVIKLGAELKVWKLRLGVSIDNPGARKLYRDSGFVEKSIILGERDA